MTSREMVRGLKAQRAGLDLTDALNVARITGATGCAAYRGIRPALKAALPYLPMHYRVAVRLAMRLADKACPVQKARRA